MEVILAIILGAAFILLIILGTVLYSAFSWGYVASIIYGWFIVSQIDTAPLIEWWQFAGVMFLVNCFVHPDRTQFKEGIADNQSTLITNLLAPWALLLAAWIFKIVIF